MIDSYIWNLLPERAPGRMHTAILAELSTIHPDVASADVSAALHRLQQSGHVRTHTRKGQARWMRNKPRAEPHVEENDTLFWPRPAQQNTGISDMNKG